MRRPLAPACAAAALFAIAVAVAGAGLPEYSHRIHPLALRGASGLPGAMLFDACAFVLPGLCLLLASSRLRAALVDAGWPARIGLVLAQLSALAYGAQGLLPMQLQDVDATANRLHALAWMLWWIAFVPGMLLLAVGMRRLRAFALVSAACGLLIPLLALLAPVDGWAGLAQRLAFGLWFGWWLLAAYGLRDTPQAR